MDHMMRTKSDPVRLCCWKLCTAICACSRKILQYNDTELNRVKDPVIFPDNHT